MNDIREELHKLINDALTNLGFEKSDGEYDISAHDNSNFGDLSTNVALMYFKKYTTFASSRILAEKIVENIKLDKKYFKKIEVAGPGFINFFISHEYLFQKLTEINEKREEFGKTDKKGIQTIVEFGDPNPFKEIHIGHLRNFCIGESFAKLLETQGHEVIRAIYQGDVGLHVAKAIWGLLKREEQFLDSSLSLSEKVKLLGESYVEGAKTYEEDEAAQKEIKEINKKIYEDDEALMALWQEGRKTSLEHFEELYARINVTFNKYYFESVTAKKGKEIVEAHIDDGVFEKDDGAVIFRGEKEGLHTRVFLTSEGYATYEAKDLALAVLKNTDVEYDESVILTGNEQLEYFQVMLKALSKISPELSSKTKHLVYGHVRLKEGKMSSRTGDVITAAWLLDEAVKKVQEAFPDMDSATAEKVGVGAVKYSMLKFSIPSDIHFSFEESVSIEGNSGPYLQYTRVRTRSVLEKFNGALGEVQATDLEKEEEELLRFLVQFPYIVSLSAQEFAPNILANYLFELSQKFNLFYQKHKIIGNEKEIFRLHLTKAVGQVLQNGLHLLGIETVEKM